MVEHFVQNKNLEDIQIRALKCGIMLEKSSIKSLYRVHTLLELYNSTVLLRRCWTQVYVVYN